MTFAAVLSAVVSAGRAVPGLTTARCVALDSVVFSAAVVVGLVVPGLMGL